MRRIAPALLALALLLNLSACTADTPEESTSDAGTPTSTTTAATPSTGDSTPPSHSDTGTTTGRSTGDAPTTSADKPASGLTTTTTRPITVGTTGHIHRFTDSGKAATCTADGYSKKACACGETLSETLPALGHDFVLVSAQAAGCTAEGISTYHCSRCKQEQRKTTAPTGHRFGDWQVSREPAPGVDGEAVRTCTGCSAKETKPLKAENELASGTWGTMTWVVYKDGTLTVTGSGAMPDGNSDSSYVNNHVLPGWCAYNQEITAIVLDDRITVIGDSNFKGLFKATSIHLPAALKEIRTKAFSTTGLGDGIVFPATLTAIGTRAFEYYKGETLTLPASVTAVGEFAFAFAPKLKTADLSRVNNLGRGAFTQCKKLENVTLSPALKQIPASLFKDCVLLTEITLPDTVEGIGDQAFANCTSLRTLHIGANSRLKTIGNAALPAQLKVFTIPKAVTTVGTGNFRNAYEVLNLSAATVPFDSTVAVAQLITDESASRVTRVDGFTFYTTPAGEGLLIGCDRDEAQITIPAQYTYKGQTVSVTGIPRFGVMGLFRTKTVELPTTLRTVDSFAFFQCPALTACVWPSTQQALDAVDFPWGKGYWSDTNTIYRQEIRVVSPGGREFYRIFASGSCGNGTVYKLYGKQSDLNNRVLAVEGSGAVTEVLHRQFVSTANIKHVVIRPGITELTTACLGQFLSAEFVYTGTEEQWQQVKKGYSWGIDQKTLQFIPDFFL